MNNQTKQPKKTHKKQPAIDSQVHNVRKETVQTQNALSVEMLTPELFHSKLETSWVFGFSTAALQLFFQYLIQCLLHLFLNEILENAFLQKTLIFLFLENSISQDERSSVPLCRNKINQL